MLSCERSRQKEMPVYKKIGKPMKRVELSWLAVITSLTQSDYLFKQDWIGVDTEIANSAV